jgi:hypothetical protein
MAREAAPVHVVVWIIKGVEVAHVILFQTDGAEASGGWSLGNVLAFCSA